jgi:hypothetical protein
LLETETWPDAEAQQLLLLMLLRLRLCITQQ